MKVSNKRGRRLTDDSEFLKNMAAMVWAGCSQRYAARMVAPRASLQSQRVDGKKESFIDESIVRRLERKFKREKDTLLKQINGCPTIDGCMLLIQRDLTPEERQAEREWAIELERRYREPIEKLKRLACWWGSLPIPVPDKHLMPRERAMQKKAARENRKYQFSFCMARQIKKAGFSKK